MGRHCPRTLSMILRWENRSRWMSCKNFDGGIRFNFITPGSTITSLPYTFIYSTFLYTPLSYILYFYIHIFHIIIFIYFNPSNSFFSFLTSPSILSYILSHLPTPFLPPLSSLLLLFILINFHFLYLYYNIHNFDGGFNTTITPRGIIITNLSFISIFIITIILIITTIPITLHPP